MDPISHGREGDLSWEWLGDNPLCPNSAEFGNLSLGTFTSATKRSKVAYIIRMSCLKLGVYIVM